MVFSKLNLIIKTNNINLVADDLNCIICIFFQILIKFFLKLNNFVDKLDLNM